MTTNLNDMDITIAGPVDSGQLRAGEPFFDFSDRISSSIGRHVIATFGSLEAAEVHITFIYTPVFLRDEANDTVQPPRPAEDWTIVSPWLALSIARGALPVVDAIVTWNEREFLLDQVRLAGADTGRAEPLASLTQAEWSAAVSLYESKVLLAASPEDRSTALEQMSASLPPDIFWLLTHAWQSTLAPFEMGATEDLSGFLGLAGPRYASLVETLIDRGFAEGAAHETYSTIHDLERVMDTNQLRIETLH